MCVRMIKIVSIEDDPNIQELLLYSLKQNGYDAVVAENGETGLELIQSEKPDLILLDLMLPGKSGFELCKELREQGNKTPIIILSAKTDEIDKILGLEFGADDYLAKPFGIRELLARIKAVLRRISDRDGGREESQSPDAQQLAIKDLVIDLERHEVMRGTEPIPLTLKEFDLLTALVRNRGRVITRDTLLSTVWSYDHFCETRTVDVHIRYLRKKLGDENEQLIKTIRGVCYKIV